MTHKEILEKAIQKAIDGGWNPYNLPDDKVQNGAWIKRMAIEATAMRSRFDLSDATSEIIFSHNFAKAFFGEEDFDNEEHMKYDKDNYGVLGLYTAWDTESYHAEPKFTGKTWQYHVQMMVVDPDPIAYLGRNI